MKLRCPKGVPFPTVLFYVLGFGSIYHNEREMNNGSNWHQSQKIETMDIAVIRIKSL